MIKLKKTRAHSEYIRLIQFNGAAIIPGLRDPNRAITPTLDPPPGESQLNMTLL